jgi:hypothetical protein
VVGEEVDGRSDLYSVGVLFYRLLTGALPFTADTALGMLQRQIRDNPTPLHSHQSNLPAWCDEIVQRALSKTPADRFQSAEEFRDALNRATGPLPAADFAKTFAVAEVPSAALLSPTDTIDLSRQEAVTATAPAKVAAAASRRVRKPLESIGMIAAAVVAGVAIGYAAMQYKTWTTGDDSSGRELAKATVPADPVDPAPALVSAPVETSPQPSTPAPVAVAPTPVVEPRPVPRPTSVPAVTEPAPDPEPPPLRAAPPVKIVRETPRTEERLETTVPEASLVFETRALVGTRKPKEQSAQLVLGEGKITIIPTSDPSTTLCAIPYGRVISINVSKSRDPLWNSPQGPAPVARAGGTLSKFGIASIREWISLRTSTDEQFVAIRFDEVIVKRVLLALEERTGRQAELVVLPTDDEKKKK